MAAQEFGPTPATMAPNELSGMAVSDHDGKPAGTISDVYVDREDGTTPRYVALSAPAADRVRLVPVSVLSVGQTDGGAEIMVACAADMIERSPTVDSRAPVTRSHEQEVVDYYRGLHEAGYMRPWAQPPEMHGAGYMRPDNEPPEAHGAGYMRPEAEPPEAHGAGYMRPETEPAELHGAGYMRPDNEPPEAGGAGRMDPASLASVRRWGDGG